MAISTNADIQRGYYGRWTKATKNNPSQFQQLGKAVTVEEIIDHLETQQTQLRLSFEHRDLSIKRITVDRRELGDYQIITTLAGVGADVTKEHAGVFVNSIRLQEEEIEATGQGVTKVYDNLGWINIPQHSKDSVSASTLLCYRASKLLGGGPASYVGTYKVKSMGNFQAWKNMVLTDVCGHPTLEFVLLAALSAVVNGLIAPVTTGENPIFHFNAPSGTGKSTAGYLGISTAGQPFEGQQKGIDKNGMLYQKISLYRSWGATANATVTSLTGNRGAPIVLNELGKFTEGDMTSIVYNLSEGSDKIRLDLALKVQQSDYYATSIISLGETSLLARCKDKLEGLMVRVMEIERPLTTSANHSRHVKEVCRANNGHAAPLLAQYIINHGGLNLVLPIYQGYCASLESKLPDTPSKSRFIEKFAALLMTTAELATKALGIPFNTDSLLAFLCEYEVEKGNERDTTMESYKAVIEACRININSFYTQCSRTLSREAWGRVKYFSEKVVNGRTVLQEYAIRRQPLNDILKKNGFPNSTTCEKGWTSAGVLSRDRDRPTRSRVIDPGTTKKEDVYVFRVFEEPSDQMEEDSIND